MNVGLSMQQSAQASGHDEWWYVDRNWLSISRLQGHRLVRVLDHFQGCDEHHRPDHVSDHFQEHDEHHHPVRVLHQKQDEQVSSHRQLGEQAYYPGEARFCWRLLSASLLFYEFQRPVMHAEPVRA